VAWQYWAPWDLTDRACTVTSVGPVTLNDVSWRRSLVPPINGKLSVLSILMLSPCSSALQAAVAALCRDADQSSLTLIDPAMHCWNSTWMGDRL